MAFRVGQKVVCVDASVHVGFGAKGKIREGAIYTVREIGITVLNEPGVRLQEFVYDSDPGRVGYATKMPFKDAFYRAARFRPLVERKTSIEIFTRMLTPDKEKA